MPSNCHQQTVESSCNEACDGDGARCHWYNPSTIFMDTVGMDRGGFIDATRNTNVNMGYNIDVGCRRACALAIDGGYNDCDDTNYSPSFADHCETKLITDDVYGTNSICRYKAGTLAGTCAANAPTECSQLNSTTCYNYNLTKAIAPYYGGGCKLNATASCVAYASAEEKKAAEDELARVAAWRAEIDRCGALSSCIDEDCKSNSTGCFPYDSPEEKALALLQAECMKIDTPLGCFAANCDFDGAVCNSFVCTQNGTLENEETVVRVLGPRWSGVNGLQCAMKTKPMSGTKKLRVILDANIGNGKYVQPAGSTGICLRSSNTTHECTSNHSVVVNPLFDHLIVVGVPHTSTGLRPIISGKTSFETMLQFV